MPLRWGPFILEEPPMFRTAGKATDRTCLQFRLLFTIPAVKAHQESLFHLVIMSLAKREHLWAKVIDRLLLAFRRCLARWAIIRCPFCFNMGKPWLLFFR